MHPVNFTARHGPNSRLIQHYSTEEARREQGHGIDVSRPNVVTSATKYLTLLLDTSTSMDETDLRQAVNDFIDQYDTGTGDTFMKLVVFSGKATVLVITPECSEGFCSDPATLHHAVNTRLSRQYLRDNWEDFYPRASSVYSSIQTALADLTVSMQAHADEMHTQHGGTEPAVATVDSLVIFTDLDETAWTATLEQTLQALRWAQPDIGKLVWLITFDLPPFYAETDPSVVQAVASAQQQFAEVLGSDFVIHASNVGELAQAFDTLADNYSEQSNAWYELFICPSVLAGTDIPVTIEVDGFDGSLTGTFDATGFGNDDSQCPHEDKNVNQAERTMFCENRQCGFSEGVFCGICDVAIARDAEYQLSPQETPVFAVTRGEIPAGGQLEFETSDGNPVAVTAHVGAQRTLVTPGHPFGGVSVDTYNVVRMAAGTAPQEMLLHVTPLALGTRWLRLTPGSSVAPELVGTPAASGSSVVGTQENCPAGEGMAIGWKVALLAIGGVVLVVCCYRGQSEYGRLFSRIRMSICYHGRIAADGRREGSKVGV